MIKIKSEIFLDSVKTIGADALSVKESYVVNVAAEDASGGVFLENDALVVNKDLYGILYIYVKRFAKLDGEYDPAELIDFANDSC
jgi:hypothetical protein